MEGLSSNKILKNSFAFQATQPPLSVNNVLKNNIYVQCNLYDLKRLLLSAKIFYYKSKETPRGKVSWVIRSRQQANVR